MKSGLKSNKESGTNPNDNPIIPNITFIHKVYQISTLSSFGR